VVGQGLRTAAGAMRAPLEGDDGDVLSGLNIPEMEALEPIEYLRRKEPFGFITAEPAPPVRQRALAAGTPYFLTELVHIAR
jgi:hypothetical protein